MHESLLPIGKMAALNRISVSTLRLYDEKGLLKPCYTDPRTGYRYYDINQNARLDMIVYMKELGMSLAEIGQVLQKEDISLIEDILSRKNEQLHQQIRQLKERHDAVERAILSIERYRKSPVTGTFSLEYIDRRYIWGIPCASNFYDDDVHSYENLLRKLRLRLEEEGFAQIHSYIISVHRLHRQILRLIVLLRHRSLFSPAAENCGKKVLQGSWKAACTHVFIWTIMTMRFLMPDGCGLSARRMDIPLPEIISVR